MAKFTRKVKKGGNVLVLKRSPGKSIHIGDDIKITYLDRFAKGARIHIVAPGSRYHGKERTIYPHDTLQLGGDVAVVFVGYERRLALIGVIAPKSVKILRGESVRPNPWWRRFWTWVKAQWSVLKKSP